MNELFLRHEFTHLLLTLLFLNVDFPKIINTSCNDVYLLSMIKNIFAAIVKGLCQQKYMLFAFFLSTVSAAI